MFLNWNGLADFGTWSCGLAGAAPAFVDISKHLSFGSAADNARPHAKNKVEKSGMFLAATLREFFHHVLPAFHHVLTIKKPRSTTSFSETPSKSPAKTQKSHAVASAGFFLKMKQSILRRNRLRK
jgi:hypothetical protein